MVNKSSFPQGLLNEKICNEKNYELMGEFRQNTKLSKNYYQTIEQILRYKKFANKPFNDFNISDILEYIEVMNKNDFSKDRINSYISFLSSFRDYFIKNRPNLFEKDFLSGLSELRIEKQKNKHEEAGSLSLCQLRALRDFIQTNIVTEYIFEIFFQLGIQKQDLNVCKPEFAIQEKMVFRRDNKREIRYNQKIKILIEKAYKEPKFDVSYTKVSYHLNKMEKYLKLKGLLGSNKSFTHSSIIKTHEKFVVTCPYCGNKAELMSPYWVLLKIEKENDLLLACSMCKGGKTHEI